MLLVSLDCPFLISSSVFSNVYLLFVRSITGNEYPLASVRSHRVEVKFYGFTLTVNINIGLPLK